MFNFVMKIMIMIKFMIISSIAIIVFGIILASWGIDDISGLLAHPARVALLSLLIAQFIVMFFFISPKWMLHSNKCKIKGNCLIGYLGIMAVILFLIISPFSDRQQWMLLAGGDFVRYLGVVLFILGNILIFWKAYYIYTKNQIITSSLFKYIHHPYYVGLIMISISIPLVFLSSLGLLLSLFASTALLEKIAREERILMQHFNL
jgi:protein-S-isoprenylcysteine O-methyltransferase Ste14